MNETMEKEEMALAIKKADIAEIKLDEIIEGAKNRRHRPKELVELT